MERNTKKRLLVVIIILLILTNISALITFSYKRYNSKKEKREFHDRNQHKRNPHKRMKEFVKEELNLDEKQFEVYCELKNKNIQNTKVHVNKIQELKRKVIVEIGKDTPDKEKLKSFSDSIGLVHSNLQTDMNQHFLDVKKILNHDQKSKLKDLMLKMDERFRIKRKHRFKGKDSWKRKQQK